MFMVMNLVRENGITVDGHKQTLKLSFADGMVGVIPVFESREAAEEYAGDGLNIVEIERPVINENKRLYDED